MVAVDTLCSNAAITCPRVNDFSWVKRSNTCQNRLVLRCINEEEEEEEEKEEEEEEEEEEEDEEEQDISHNGSPRANKISC